MSATDELRRLLDERGVEYKTDDRNGLKETIWCGTAAFQLSPTAEMTMIVTPEQAIAATLDTRAERTCHFSLVVDQDPSRKHRGNIHECSVCGTRYAWGFIVDERLNYCPNCGCKVVSE